MSDIASSTLNNARSSDNAGMVFHQPGIYAPVWTVEFPKAPCFKPGDNRLGTASQQRTRETTTNKTTTPIYNSIMNNNPSKTHPLRRRNQQGNPALFSRISVYGH